MVPTYKPMVVHELISSWLKNETLKPYVQPNTTNYGY
jgi:hypothetical protein